MERRFGRGRFHINKRQSANIIFIMILSLVLSGCSQDGGDPVVITHKPYEKEVYETTTVQKGTLTPELNFTLRMTKIKRIQYSVTDANLELDRIAVSIGDKVKKGDLLVSFISEELENTLAEYKEKKEQNDLLKKHYENLQKADKGADYRKELKDLKREQEVTQLYIEETEKKIEKNRIYAKRAGTITNVSSKLKEGTFRAGTSLVTETYGSGIYKAEVDESVELKKGEKIQASDGSFTCKLKVTEVKRQDSGKQIVYFKPVSDMREVSEDTKLTVHWKKPPLKDCIYVEKKAVSSWDGRHFVRLMDDQGYFQTAEVSLGQEEGEFIIITSGLSGGEKVRLE